MKLLVNGIFVLKKKIIYCYNFKTLPLSVLQYKNTKICFCLNLNQFLKRAQYMTVFHCVKHFEKLYFVYIICFVLCCDLFIKYNTYIYI